MESSASFLLDDKPANLLIHCFQEPTCRQVSVILQRASNPSTWVCKDQGVPRIAWSVLHHGRNFEAHKTIRASAPTRVRSPRHDERAVVLDAVKAEPVIAKRCSASTGGPQWASPDSICARRPRHPAVGAKISLRRGRTEVRMEARGWAPAWAGASETAPGPPHPPSGQFVLARDTELLVGALPDARGASHLTC
jgi:hypothetical protein